MYVCMYICHLSAIFVVCRSRYLRMVDKQRQIDEQEMKTLEADKENFLLQAVGNYLKCLRVGDRHDLRVFRLTSLWFDNNTSQQINTHIRVGNYTRSSLKWLICIAGDGLGYGLGLGFCSVQK